MYVYDAKTFNVKSSLNVDSSVYSVAFSPDGTTLAAGCFGQIYFVDPTAGEIKLKVDYRIFCLSYAPNGDMLAVGDQGANINVFNSQGEKLQSPVRGHTDVVTSVCFSSDGKELTSGSQDSTVRTWDPATRASLS